jgi:hypothetical protein
MQARPANAGSKPPLSRRAFVRSAGVLVVGLVAINSVVRHALAAAGDWYRRVMRLRNFSGPAVTVYKMAPLPGCRYSKADLAHMTNKIFPSPEAALARRQHAMFFYGLKAVSLPRSATNGFDGRVLFLSRKEGTGVTSLQSTIER